MAGAHPNLALGGRQPFGLGVVAEDVEEDVRLGLEGPGRTNVLVVDNFALPSAHHKQDLEHNTTFSS